MPSIGYNVHPRMHRTATDDETASVIGDLFNIATEDVKTRPAVSWEIWRDDTLTVTLDTARFLEGNAMHAPAVTRLFRYYCHKVDPTNDKGATTMAESFANWIESKGYGEGMHGYMGGTTFTYNVDNLLSVDLLFTIFELDGATYAYVIPMPGISTPYGPDSGRMFLIGRTTSADFYDYDDFHLSCTREPSSPPLPGMPDDVRHGYEFRHGDVIDQDGSYIGSTPWSANGTTMRGENEDGEPFIRCPACGARCDVHTWWD